MDPGRIAHLLDRAAEELEAGRNPFSAQWQARHDITEAECRKLADTLAAGARLVTAGIRNEKIMHGALAAAHADGTYDQVQQALDRAVRS